jgi:hypothetical protein
MTGKTAKRLARLDLAFLPKGCAVCRRWSPIVFADDQGESERLDVCPGCGRNVPILMTICVVGVALETV